MATVKWASSPTQKANQLTTELNSLTNGSFSAAGTAYDNTSNLDEWAWFEFIGGGSITPTAGANVQIFMVTSLDGSNYGTGGSSTNPAWDQLVANIPVKTGAGTPRETTSFAVQLPPCKFKFVLRNGTGVTLSASGNILNMYVANEAVA